MSNWTHVAGIIRVDALPREKLDFDKLIGEEWQYGDAFYVASNDFLPDGSEGSLQKSVWEDTDSSNMARYTVSIFGDLRDHHDPQAIIDWFKEKCDTLWVRQAIITVWNEWNGTLDWRYNGYDE
jgi:hypothetical protein